MKNRVIFSLRGRMCERFVARAVREGVMFEAVERISAEEMRLVVRQRMADAVVSMAEEYRLNLTRLGEEGIPFWKKRLKERGGLALGLLLALVTITFFTSRIWRVEAVSLDGMADSELLAAIGEMAVERGARIGVMHDSVDRDALAADIHAAWPELTYVSVRINGVYLRVEVAVEEPAPKVYDTSAHRDLVADRDAVVLYVEPLAGQAAVRAGDIVRRGQTLIRGEERIDEENTRGVRALGKVLGRVWFTAVCEEPVSGKVPVRTGRKDVSLSLRLGIWEWKIKEAGEFERQETQEETLPIGGLYLPLRLVRTVRWETDETTVSRDRSDLLTEVEEKALQEARLQLPDGAEETACWTEQEEKDGKLIVRATIEAQMNIAADRSDLSGGFNE